MQDNNIINGTSVYDPLHTPSKFNTTPNGTTIIQVADVINSPTTLIVDPIKTTYIDNLLFFNPTIKTFLFQPGNYKLVNILKIKTPGIQFIGITGSATQIQITQTLNFDGMLLQADNIIIQDISIHCGFAGKSCLIVASANNTIVSGCHFYGMDTGFTIYYAGPKNLTEGQSTLDGYTNYVLDTGNIFCYNVVYADFVGDSVSYSLQYKGQFVGNIIRGGKLAVYMCRTTNIYNNIINDSTSQGIYLSFPSDNISLIGNKIYNSRHSSIKMGNQLEHGIFTGYNYNIIVQHNTIFNSQVYGIELNNANNIRITNNSITSGKTMGIYSYFGSNLIIKSNKIAYFNYAIFLELTTQSSITGNNIMSIYPNLGQNGIKITSDSIVNTIVENNMYGKYRYDLTADSGTGNIMGINPVIPYYTLDDEKSIFNVI
jgi:nitrous oxidase accessory protein NosD